MQTEIKEIITKALNEHNSTVREKYKDIEWKNLSKVNVGPGGKELCQINAGFHVEEKWNSEYINKMLPHALTADLNFLNTHDLITLDDKGLYLGKDGMLIREVITKQ